MGQRTGLPEAGARLMRVFACCAGAVLLAASTLNANDDGAVISLSVVPSSGRAQVVIGVDGDVKVRDFVLHDPERIVVDITGARLGVAGSKSYDGVARGGVLNVKVAQNQPNVVRVVLAVDGPRLYDVVRGKGAIMVSVEGGGKFVAWRTGQFVAPVVASAPVAPVAAPKAQPVMGREVVLPPPSQAPVRASQAMSTLPFDFSEPQGQQSQAPITITFDKSPIVDVLSAFAAYARRTIIPAKGVEATTITAEIKGQPWDVALKVILNANGLDVVEDASNGIMIVNTLEALAARPRLEALTTVTLRFNYTAAAAVAEAVRGRLTRDCGSQTAGPVGVAPVGGAQAGSPMNCPVRGTVSADSLTNSVSITDGPTALPDIVAYAKSLDVRQPQVNIKAKIILVDRTQLEGLGLKYDIGSRNQHFNTIIARADSTGAAETGNVIFLGGNTLSAIANAAQSVPGAALSIVYSAALGAFDFTTFLEALQDVSLLDVQAEPSVTTLNYRTASLSAGTQVPIRTAEAGAGSNSAGQVAQVTVDFRQTGIVLTVTPFITNNRQIKMKVTAENSDVQFIAGEGAVFPTQKLDNELLVADGETAVMGGLTQTSVRVTKSGIPLLVDLPLIGRLFGVTNRQETKRDLLILITPHIVDDGDMTMEPRRQP
jgi:type IV pilus assembly protein PilQ